MFQGCSKKYFRMLQGRLKDVSIEFLVGFKNVSKKLNGCLRSFQCVSRMFQGSLRGFTKSLKGVSRKFKRCLRKFQECFKEVSGKFMGVSKSLRFKGSFKKVLKGV